MLQIHDEIKWNLITGVIPIRKNLLAGNIFLFSASFIFPFLVQVANGSNNPFSRIFNSISALYVIIPFSGQYSNVSLPPSFCGRIYSLRFSTIFILSQHDLQQLYSCWTPQSWHLNFDSRLTSIWHFLAPRWHPMPEVRSSGSRWGLPIVWNNSKISAKNQRKIKHKIWNSNCQISKRLCKAIEKYFNVWRTIAEGFTD